MNLYNCLCKGGSNATTTFSRATTSSAGDILTLSMQVFFPFSLPLYVLSMQVFFPFPFSLPLFLFTSLYFLYAGVLPFLFTYLYFLSLSLHAPLSLHRFPLFTFVTNYFSFKSFPVLSHLITIWLRPLEKPRTGSVLRTWFNFHAYIHVQTQQIDPTNTKL